MTEYRMEKDSIGDVRVPKDAYWGAQTQRAIENFPVSGIIFPPVFVRSLATLKRACARVNQELGLLEPRIAAAIIRSCDEIIEGRHDSQFPVDVFQTGSGTSTNMNVNEVVAARSNEILTGARQTSTPVRPNDHVNMGQSSNDVIPSAIHIAASIQTRSLLLPALELLHRTIEEKRSGYGTLVKTGRTHLMDAVPMTLGQEMSGWATQVAYARERIESALPRLSELAMGGTAVGTGINAPAGFGTLVAREVSTLTGVEFTEAKNHFEAQASQDAIVELSGHLKTYATGLMKIANDLRWMNSGPVAGLGEIRLPSLQPGSSIMPGKVNPVIPEAARMVAAQIMGNDTVIALSNAAGDFQLNAMLPVIAHNILQSLALLSNGTRLLAEKAIRGFDVNEDRIAQFVHANPIIATVLMPIIGYDRSAEVVKKALEEKKSVRQAVVEMGYLSAEEAEKILNPGLMTGPGLP